MALLKEIEQPTGLKPKYWKVVQLTLDVTTKRTMQRFWGFLTQEDRDANLAPIVDFWEESDIDPEYYNPILDVAYSLDKRMPLFENAVDV